MAAAADADAAATVMSSREISALVQKQHIAIKRLIQEQKWLVEQLEGLKRHTPYKYKTEPCEFYARGYCREGDDCPFIHDGSDVPVRRRDEPRPPA